MNDLKTLKWPQEVKEMQKNWIGKFEEVLDSTSHSNDNLLSNQSHVKDKGVQKYLTSSIS